MRERGATRGQQVAAQQSGFFDERFDGPADALAGWRRARDARHLTYMDEAGGDRETTEAGIAPTDGPPDEGYGAVAVGFLRAVVTDAAERLIVNTANMGRLPFLDDDAVVEAPTLVGREGCAPVAVGALLPEQRELVIRVKEVERLTLRASSERSAALAMQAIAQHPVVDSRALAERIFAGVRGAAAGVRGPVRLTRPDPRMAAAPARPHPIGSPRDHLVSAVIRIEGLRKEYRRLRGGTTTAVDGLDLEVPEGGVFGFLGPNGAGKTTTIRCLVGLVAPGAGRVSVLGADIPRELPGVIRRVGSIVETPALFARFTGRRNLEILARIDGIGRSAVDDVLGRVGLGDRADDLVKTYSLGMKQRLGIGAALLKDPALLILDEPANGLDPAGIVEVRELLRRLGAEGRTVFVSSHILSEIQQTADRVAILARGRCVREGAVADVLASQGGEGLIVRLRDLEAGRFALDDAGIASSISGDALRVNVATTEAERVSRTLAERGLYVTELRPEEVDLETVFLELTRDQGIDGGPAS